MYHWLISPDSSNGLPLKKEINAEFKKASESTLKGILGYSTIPVVSYRLQWLQSQLDH
jgi:glyceraldehyde-3-phosphate dehydrogenase/erythrose-4-phosphate dehydrogenase